MIQYTIMFAKCNVIYTNYSAMSQLICLEIRCIYVGWMYIFLCYVEGGFQSNSVAVSQHVLIWL